MCKVADFGLSRNVRDSAGEMYEQRVKVCGANLLLLLLLLLLL